MAISYLNQGATRNLPVSEEVARIYEQAAKAAGIDEIRVISGGQEATGSHRTGSHRHDLGGAGDIKLVVGGRVLDMGNPEDLPIISNFVSSAKQAGATGIGAGSDYMGNQTIHVGMGAPGIWGAAGKSANAPGWLQKAYGTTLTSTPVSAAPTVASAEAPTEAPTKMDKFKSLIGGKGADGSSGLEDIVSSLAKSKPSNDTAEITPSSIGSAPIANPAAAAQLMTNLLTNRRNRYGISLMG